MLTHGCWIFTFTLSCLILLFSRRGGGTTGCWCRFACDDERGYTRSHDLDLCDLLERFLCSADGGGPADGDEGFTIVKSSSDISSSDSGVTVGRICGSCGTGTWGFSRSRDVDHCLRLCPCGGWSSSCSPSLSGIGISWGSGGEDRGCNRSRNVFPVPTLSLPPAGDGAGGHPGGNPGGPKEELQDHQRN